MPLLAPTTGAVISTISFLVPAVLDRAQVVAVSMKSLYLLPVFMPVPCRLVVRPPLLPQRTSFRPFWEKITSPLTVQASVPAAAPVPPQVEVAVSKTAFESLTLERERGQMLRATMLGYPAAYWVG